MGDGLGSQPRQRHVITCCCSEVWTGRAGKGAINLRVPQRTTRRLQGVLARARCLWGDVHDFAAPFKFAGLLVASQRKPLQHLVLLGVVETLRLRWVAQRTQSPFGVPDQKRGTLWCGATAGLLHRRNGVWGERLVTAWCPRQTGVTFGAAFGAAEKVEPVAIKNPITASIFAMNERHGDSSFIESLDRDNDKTVKPISVFLCLRAKSITNE
jgi:hypothetical protein